MTAPKIVGNCWNCGQDLGEFEYGRGDSCTKCGRDTHCCKNCDFYAVELNNNCREPQADRVVEKERSNFCDYFKPKFMKPGHANAAKDSLKAAAEALFKKKT